MPAAHSRRHPERAPDARHRRRSPTSWPAATPTSPRAPTCNCAKFRRAQRAGSAAAAVRDLGLTSRGAGADNIRNVTGSPTAGIDPQELIDTRPLRRASCTTSSCTTASCTACRASSTSPSTAAAAWWCWRTPTTSRFTAVQVADGFGVAPGVYFRLGLGGITGHRDFARDDRRDRAAGAMPCAVANAILRAFIAHGDRTDRTKARLKYVLDRMGVAEFLARGGEGTGRAAAAGRCGGDPAASGAGQARPYRRASAEAGGAELCRRGLPGRAADLRSAARPGRYRRSRSAPARCG